jgi:CRP-like cAMP-binding protein
VDDRGLTSIPLFDGCDPDQLAGLAAALEPRRLEPGERLMTQGEPGSFFAIVVAGEVAVVRDDERGPVRLAVVGAGSVLGELALLRARSRSATVAAVGAADVLTGDARAFDALLDLPEVHDRIRRLVSGRLAEDARPVPAALRDGTPVLLRPLLPSDRAAVAVAVRELSEQSLRRRFFTGGQPSQRTIDYLVDIDYVDHFAWLVLDGADPADGLATVRYIRRHGVPDEAELAFAVKDAFQGHGIGTLMLGAIGAAASVTGIRMFRASLLAENEPMRAVLTKGGADFTFEEPGVVGASLAVHDAACLVDEPLREALQGAARDVVTAAGLALTRAPGS